MIYNLLKMTSVYEQDFVRKMCPHRCLIIGDEVRVIDNIDLWMDIAIDWANSEGKFCPWCNSQYMYGLVKLEPFEYHE